MLGCNAWPRFVSLLNRLVIQYNFYCTEKAVLGKACKGVPCVDAEIGIYYSGRDRSFLFHSRAK